MKKITSLILVFIIVFSLSGCIPREETPKELTMNVLGTANNFLPSKAKTDAEKIISSNCFEGLFRFDSDSKLDLSGAVGLTVDKFNLNYTFKLNPSACWYMGGKTKENIDRLNIKNFKNTITAKDYIFGIEQFILSGNNELYSIDGAKEFAKGKAKEIKGLTAEDDYTLSFRLKKIDPDFIYKLATLPVYPCNKEVFEALGSSYGKSPEATLFNGAYFVKSINSKEVFIERNDFYKGNLQVKNSGVRLKNAQSIEEMEKNFLKGKTDIYISPGYRTLPGDTTSILEIKSTWGIAFNCKSPMGSKSELRDILLSSIDYSKISLPSFAREKAKRLIPLSYTVGDSNYEDFEPYELSYIKNLGSAQKNMDTLIIKSGVTSFNIKFYVPEEMKNQGEEIIKNWKILFQNKLKVELVLFNIKDTEKISKEAKYDLAILPLEAKNKTAFGVIESIKTAPCYYEDKILNSLMSYIKAANHENASICKRAEKLIVDNGVFVPLFFDSNELYLNQGVRGIFMANGGSSVYFNLGSKGDNIEKKQS